MAESRSLKELLDNGTRELPIEETMEHVYKFHGHTIKNQMQAIQDTAAVMKPKGIRSARMKIGSVPEDVRDMLLQKYGRMKLQEPTFWVWFFEKFKRFKYFPSANIGRRRL